MHCVVQLIYSPTTMAGESTVVLRLDNDNREQFPLYLARLLNRSAHFKKCDKASTLLDSRGSS